MKFLFRNSGSGAQESEGLTSAPGSSDVSSPGSNIFLNVYIAKRMRRNHGRITVPQKGVKLCRRVKHSFLCRSSMVTCSMNLVGQHGSGEM